MRQLIKATTGQAGIINAIAIGFALELISGRLDSKKEFPGYVKLLEFVTGAKPELQTWDQFKTWLTENNKPSQIEAFLTPILILLNQNDLKGSLVQGQRNYESSDLKILAEQLSLGFMINEEPSTSDQSLRLAKTDEGWGIRCEDLDIDSYLTLEEPVSSTKPEPESEPESESEPEPEVDQALKTVSSATEVVIKSEPRENPGLGNCAFYAFAIGLIEIIQYEKACNTSDIFDRWVKADPSIAVLYDTLCTADTERLDKSLLDKLQTSLRVLSYEQQVKELKTACVQLKYELVYWEGDISLISLFNNNSFNNFLNLYYENPVDSNYNPLVSSKKIKNAVNWLHKQFAKEQAAQIEKHPDTTPEMLVEIERKMLFETFISLLYGKKATSANIDENSVPLNDSPIIEGMAKVTEDFIWGTHLDLDSLANFFRVNLHVNFNGQATLSESHDIEGRHTITVNNLGVVHWNTEVTVAKLKSSVTPGLKESLPHKKKTPKPVKDKPEEPQKVSQPEPAKVEPAKPEPAEQAKVELPEQTKPVPVNPADTELKALKEKVLAATLAYVGYSDKIKLSIFHRHGNAGKERAINFNKKFIELDDLGEAKRVLKDFLEDNKNGNTHPHSYRTMLLKGLTKNETYDPNLKEVSKNYSKLEDEYIATLNIKPASARITL